MRAAAWLFVLLAACAHEKELTRSSPGSMCGDFREVHEDAATVRADAERLRLHSRAGAWTAVEKLAVEPQEGASSTPGLLQRKVPAIAAALSDAGFPIDAAARTCVAISDDSYLVAVDGRVVDQVVPGLAPAGAVSEPCMDVDAVRQLRLQECHARLLANVLVSDAALGEAVKTALSAPAPTEAKPCRVHALRPDPPQHATWPVPEGFRAETLGLPPEFAPALPLHGVEHVRFGPGFSHPWAVGRWNYAFTWRVAEPDPVPDASAARSLLEGYFRGLCTVGKKPAPPEQVHVSANGRLGSYKAQLRMPDCLYGGLPLDLGIRLWRLRCERGSLVVVLASPFVDAEQEPVATLWRLADEAACEQFALH